MQSSKKTGASRHGTKQSEEEARPLLIIRTYYSTTLSDALRALSPKKMLAPGFQNACRDFKQADRTLKLIYSPQRLFIDTNTFAQFPMLVRHCVAAYAKLYRNELIAKAIFSVNTDAEGLSKRTIKLIAPLLMELDKRDHASKFFKKSDFIERLEKTFNSDLTQNENCQAGLAKAEYYDQLWRQCLQPQEAAQPIMQASSSQDVGASQSQTAVASPDDSDLFALLSDNELSAMLSRQFIPDTEAAKKLKEFQLGAKFQRSTEGKAEARIRLNEAARDHLAVFLKFLSQKNRRARKEITNECNAQENLKARLCSVITEALFCIHNINEEDSRQILSIDAFGLNIHNEGSSSIKAHFAKFHSARLVYFSALKAEGFTLDLQVKLGTLVSQLREMPDMPRVQRVLPQLQETLIIIRKYWDPQHAVPLSTKQQSLHDSIALGAALKKMNLPVKKTTTVQAAAMHSEPNAVRQGTVDTLYYRIQALKQAMVDFPERARPTAAQFFAASQQQQSSFSKQTGPSMLKCWFDNASYGIHGPAISATLPREINALLVQLDKTVMALFPAGGQQSRDDNLFTDFEMLISATTTASSPFNPS